MSSHVWDGWCSARSDSAGEIRRGNGSGDSIAHHTWIARHIWLFVALILAALLFASSGAWGQSTRPVMGQAIAPATEPSAQEQSEIESTPVPKLAHAKFKKMSLDELMNVQVTSVSRHESTVGQSAAAVTVITQDDISASGALSIPDLLRMVPGMEVAQTDSSGWEISARGFNSTADKLLVLTDGRSDYSPLFSGVFWDVQNAMLQDIDRIEVIRGPAGTMWGANAVNGVVDIITKDASQTQGLLVSGGGGSYERDFVNDRYGWQVSDNTYARVYFMHFDRDETKLADGADGDDSWTMTQGGFRVDSQPTTDNHLTLQGDIYSGEENNPDLNKTDLAGGNVLGRWTHNFDGGGDVQLQMYYDRADRNIPETLQDNCDTFDLDFQSHIPLGTRQDVTWGLGYRFIDDHLGDDPIISFVPNVSRQSLYSGFVQDEISLVPDKLKLTLGTKLEHNDFSGFEVEPNARLLWSIDKRQSAWASVSRAVRTPTQLDEDVRITEGTTDVIGNPDFVSEEVVAYELGYRVQPIDALGFDIATYYNNYDKLRSLDLVGSDLIIGNNLEGQTYGVEVGSTWQATDWWKLRLAYTYMKVQLQTVPGSTDFISVQTAGEDPQNQVYLSSGMNLPHNVQLDADVRYVSDLPALQMPSYVTADVKLAWDPTKNLELSVVGRNLFNSQHIEFGSGLTAHEIPRSVYGMVTYRY